MTTVTVRMYNVGFGDSFLITVTQDSTVWRMLLDCGVHWQGQARPINQTVRAIISDLKEAGDGSTPRLDVVAATHHHADHIAGFAVDDWDQVEVGEVWLPFVEDESDPTAIELRRRQAVAADRLVGLISTHPALAAAHGKPMAAAARDFAMHALRNADATDRLLGRGGKGFANQPVIRFLPSPQDSENTIDLGVAGARAHVFGPPRDPDRIKLMDPPPRVAWLQLDGDSPASGTAPSEPLFDGRYVLAEDQVSPERIRARDELWRHLDEQVLAACSILERAVNNTSLFFVLDVQGSRLVFPGDAQHGAWQHVLANPEWCSILADAVFYKIGHHGSHNATPKQFVNEIWQDGHYAMLPYGRVRRWEKTIPKEALLTALEKHGHKLVRSDRPAAVTPDVTVKDNLWTEIRFVTDA